MTRVAIVLLALLTASSLGLVTSQNRARKLFAELSRQQETAHQLGTPVSSLEGWVEMLKESNTDATINLKSIARIWKAFVFHRTTDYFGPIPYSKIGLDSTVVPYDSQKDVYYGLFQELTEAVADLKNNISKPWARKSSG